MTAASSVSSQTLLSAEHIVIATGGRPRYPTHVSVPRAPAPTPAVRPARAASRAGDLAAVTGGSGQASEGGQGACPSDHTGRAQQ